MRKQLINAALASVIFLLLFTQAFAQRIQPEYKQRNWPAGGGSCVHCSMITSMYYQGRPDIGYWWFQNHGGGETVYTMAEQFNAAKIPFYTTTHENNEAWLEWAVANDLCPGVAIYNRAHMVNLVDITPTHVCLLDNNNVSRYYWLRRDVFMKDWKASGSWAICPVLISVSPPPQ